MRAVKRILGLLLAALLALVAVVIARALLLAPPRAPDVPPAPAVALDRDAMAARLAEAIRCETISFQDHAAVRREEFEKLHRHLERSFPRVHAAMRREVVSGLSLLYTWEGREPAQKPVLLMAHEDVVPVEAGSEARWSEPPFSGKVAGGFVWGRGALDDKEALLGLFEAAESLLAAGFTPRRTILFALGQDEEVGGNAGNAKIAALLAERGVAVEWVLDEGLAVTRGIVPGLARPVALVGTAEKGYVSAELLVEGAGGHSSAPPRETAAGVVAAAVARLEASPFPARMDLARPLCEAIGPELGFAGRLVTANLWLFSPVIERALAKEPPTDALIRTTTAPTMLEASPKENVLPQRARAVVNFRILPGDTVESVLARVRRTIDDPRVAVRALAGMSGDPSRRSSADSRGYRAIERAIREVVPDAVVAPSIVIAGTDSRHYEAIAADVYRFVPITVGPEDMTRFHGTDERVAVDDYERCVRFYRRLLEGV
jgi:carboxypeptidase PM20D1